MKEGDIRPADLFNRYLELSERDAAALLTRRDDFVTISCPACGGEGERAFDKNGYTYEQCPACGSLFLNPRPDEAMMAEFYETAESVKFWATDFYRSTVEARREKMFRPRAALAAEIADTAHLPSDASIVDVGAGYGVFLEEVRELGRFSDILGVEPAAELASACREKGFEVVEATVEEVPRGQLSVDMAVAFEVLEHVLDPIVFLKGIAGILPPGGVTLLTSLTCDGFDLRVLREKSKSIYAPHHINILSLEGYRRLLKNAGLELVSLSTPGKLDLNIVANAWREDPELQGDEFLKFLALDSDETTQAAFQSFLQANLLSSHVSIVARRPL